MYRRGRPPVDQFADDELLFQRYDNRGYSEGVKGSEHVAELQKISEQIRCAEQSVNRGLFSRPADVLFPDSCRDGIAQYERVALAGEINVYYDPKQRVPKIPNWRLGIEHAPLEDNYAHSNYFAMRDGSRFPRDGKLPKVAKKAMRERIVGHPSVRVLRRPSPSEWFAWLKRRLGL